MVVLIDSNVVLDQILKNKDFYKVAEDILALSEKGVIDGYVSASAITDIYYIARKAYQDKNKALELISALTEIVHIAVVDEGIVKSAIDLAWSDFEDSVQYKVGDKIGAEYIITRDLKGFALSSIQVIDPESFLSLISNG
jgi:predicted nucleic acid-binding protein